MFLSVSVLSLRPGGLRRQLRFVARRLRIVLILGGIYVFATTTARLVLQRGPIVDWGPPVLAVLLALAFVAFAQDPKSRPESASRS